MMVAGEKVILCEVRKKCNFKSSWMDCQEEEGNQKMRIKWEGKIWTDGTCLDGITAVIFREQERKARCLGWGTKRSQLCVPPQEEITLQSTKATPRLPRRETVKGKLG